MLRDESTTDVYALTLEKQHIKVNLTGRAGGPSGCDITRCCLARAAFRTKRPRALRLSPSGRLVQHRREVSVDTVEATRVAARLLFRFSRCSAGLR
jgi:hypothetical protein